LPGSDEVLQQGFLISRESCGVAFEEAVFAGPSVLYGLGGHEPQITWSETNEPEPCGQRAVRHGEAGGTSAHHQRDAPSESP